MHEETTASIDRDLARLREVLALYSPNRPDDPFMTTLMNAIYYLHARRIQAEYRERGIDTEPQA